MLTVANRLVVERMSTAATPPAGRHQWGQVSLLALPQNVPVARAAIGCVVSYSVSGVDRFTNNDVPGAPRLNRCTLVLKLPAPTDTHRCRGVCTVVSGPIAAKQQLPAATQGTAKRTLASLSS